VSDVTVTFKVGKADLSKTDKEKLASLGDQVNSTKSYIVQVTGGTDSTGGADLNYQLSQRRAETVVQYLASQYNIPPRKFYLIGIGKDKEVASNKTAAGRAQNRRVEVQLLTNMDQQAKPQQGQQGQPTAQPPAQQQPAVSAVKPQQ
jgi:outer membrane protein OmpA-like peptidoglycan-associated protein